MNHPSDYMNNFQDDSSSDSSNPTVKITHRTNSRPTRSLLPPTNNPKKPKPKPPKAPKKARPSKQHPPAGKQRSCSDYLILGDSYLTSTKAKEITRRLVEQQREETPRVMRVQRLKKKEQACIRKIEAYIQTFVQGIRTNKAIRSLAKPDKITLYELLKAEQRRQEEEGESLQGYFRMAVDKLQQVSSGIQQEFPSKHRVISKWKNHKLHQLSSAQSFLSQQREQPLCDWEAQLAFLAQQKFFPELKKQAQELTSSITSHLREQQERGSAQEDAGVKWVLQRLLKFILEREEILNNVLEGLQQSAFPLLDDGLFIQFSREVIGSSEDESEAEEQRYVHMFNKAIFDLVNQAAPDLLPQCQYEAIDQVLAWLFETATKYEREDPNNECLLGVAEALFEGLLEEALWDFLEYL